MPRRLIYVDLVAGGHHPSHLAFHADRCAALGVELLAVVPRQVWDQAQGERTRQDGAAYLLRDAHAPPTGIRAKLRLLLEVRGLAGADGESAWYFPVLDDFLLCLIPACAFGVVGRWSGIMFRDDFNYPQDELARPGKLIRSILRYLVLVIAHLTATPSIGTLNPAWRAWLPKHPTWIPDALSLSDEADPPAAPAASAPREAGRIRLLMFGAMTPRKGLVPMLQAILHSTPETQARIALKIIGEFQDAPMRLAAMNLLSRIEAAGVPVSVEDRYVYSAELDQAIAGCDLVLAPYQNHIGSSGVLGLAARFGKPILGQGAYQMGEEIRAFGLGVAVDTGSVEALRTGLAGLLDTDPARFQAGQARFRAARNRATAAAALDGLIARLWKEG